jgi:hypothetical protein
MSYRFGIMRTAQKTVGAVKIYCINEKNTAAGMFYEITASHSRRPEPSSTPL